MRLSHIEWTDHTFNPWWGCTKVSGGCKNCYAETLAGRFGNDCWGPKGPRKMMSEAYWRQPETWDKAAKAEGVRRRVFCASMADVFEATTTMPAESWLDVYRARERLFALIGATRNLDWLLLTKRPEKVMDYVPLRWHGIDSAAFPPNVWIGTSVEDQKTADERIPELLRIPARVRFLSCEPLLGPVDLRMAEAVESIKRIQWVICGGESGPNARPMHPDWARSLRDQCVGAAVPFFFKQWGEYGPVVVPHTDKGMVRLGKKRTGRMLDGREWSEFPMVAA